MVSDGNDLPDHFVPGYKRIGRNAKFVPVHRKIRMTETAVFHGDFHLFVPQWSGIEFIRREPLSFGRSGIGVNCFVHWLSPNINYFWVGRLDASPTMGSATHTVAWLSKSKILYWVYCF